LVDARGCNAAAAEKRYVAKRETKAWTKRNDRSIPAWLASALFGDLVIRFPSQSADFPALSGLGMQHTIICPEGNKLAQECHIHSTNIDAPIVCAATKTKAKAKAEMPYQKSNDRKKKR
jgi:hypothetical protein